MPVSGPGVSGRIEPRGTRVRKAAVQNIASGSAVAFVWDTVDFDNKGAFNVSNNTRLTAWADGFYLSILGVSSQNITTTDAWETFISINGAATPGSAFCSQRMNTDIGGARGETVVFMDFLNKDDYVEGYIDHTIGVNFDFSGVESGFFSLVRLWRI